MFILKRFKLVGGPNSNYDGLDGDSYNMEALGDYSNYPFFFQWTSIKSQSFPSFKFDTDNVPIGDSTVYCLGIQWIPMRQRSQFDKYMPVKGFNECKMYSEGIAYWEDDYPKNGINFKLWDQHEKKGDTVCVGGIYNEMANTCFTYDTIKKICMLVKFTKDHETNSYSWVYTGGCFEGGKAVLYKPAEVGERH